MMACGLVGAKPLLNQCWNIVNSKLRNKLQWNKKRNSYIFVQENAFENVVCEMAAILSQPQCVNPAHVSLAVIQMPLMIPCHVISCLIKGNMSCSLLFAEYEKNKLPHDFPSKEYVEQAEKACHITAVNINISTQSSVDQQYDITRKNKQSSRWLVYWMVRNSWPM